LDNPINSPLDCCRISRMLIKVIHPEGNTTWLKQDLMY
jgi:hypothetical protein